MKDFLELKVRHSGIFLKGLYYYHPELLRYTGNNVLVKTKKRHLKVYNTNGVFICKAKADLFKEKSA